VRVAASAVAGGLVTLWVTLVNPNHQLYGPVGLALASGLAAWLEWSLLRARLRQRIPGIALGAAHLRRLIAVALAAALLARGIEYLLPDWHPILVGAVVLTPYALLYLGLVQVLGLEVRVPFLGRLLARKARASGQGAGGGQR
jgi:peptidoglycan biosynthesis protein MviN/MurJ (putative lipid II flippase)